jgi:RHS repeat-associated protein
MPGRGINGSYRYGFNGKENDKEVVGTGQGTQDYGFRIYNPSLGKFLSVDPLTAKYPMLTPYQFASNRPIDGVDQDGLEYATSTIFVQYGKVKDIVVVKDYELKSKYTLGPGVQLNYAYLDKNGKVEKFVAGPNVENNIYGIYGGSKNPQLPEKGGDPYKLQDDYSLTPIDEADNGAMIHDLTYDKLKPKQTGLSGVLGKSTTPANEAAENVGADILHRYVNRNKDKEGGIDKISGKTITQAEVKGSLKLMEGFNLAEYVKTNILPVLKPVLKAVGEISSNGAATPLIEKPSN